ncbi:helix-hairpin-helix domain-containing protein, partial [Klebsiella pneumoniae]|uniref:helix-hairpin-helix domain-containing protein n=1 Tax=Klebsiella pneumoniae TaxID=573 RepID=UPI0022309005
DLDKPRGFSVIGVEEAQDFLAPRPVTLLPGVGPAFARKLEKDGYRRIGDVASADPKRLVALYGVGGAR